jgi:hypothetical protein
MQRIVVCHLICKTLLSTSLKRNVVKQAVSNLVDQSKKVVPASVDTPPLGAISNLVDKSMKVVPASVDTPPHGAVSNLVDKSMKVVPASGA